MKVKVCVCVCAYCVCAPAKPEDPPEHDANPNYRNKRYCFRRGAPSQVPLEVRVAWHGESISMDKLIDHMEQFGVCALSDWQSSKDYNEVSVRFHSEGGCHKAEEMTIQKIVDSKGKPLWLKVN